MQSPETHCSESDAPGEGPGEGLGICTFENIPDDNCEYSNVDYVLDAIIMSTLNLEGVLMALCLCGRMS